MRLASLALAALAASASADQLAPAAPLAVTVVPKTVRRHAEFGRGPSLGFAVDGREGAVLAFGVGRKYTFNVSAVDCRFPFGVFDATTGLEADGSTPAACDGTVTWTPTPEQAGGGFRYGSPALPFMGSPVAVEAAGTFCNRNSARMGVSNLEFIGAVCDLTFANLARSGPEMIGFFTGHKGPTNYFADPEELGALRGRLVSYFGNQFGCTDEGFPSYAGPSMSRLHAGLEIGRVHFDGFCDALLDAMRQAEVPPADVAWAKRFLDTFFTGSAHGEPHGVCNALDCRTSLCDRMADEAGIVGAALLGRVAEAALDRFAALPAFARAGVRVPADRARAAADLVAFYGQHAVLSCTDDAFPRPFEGGGGGAPAASFHAAHLLHGMVAGALGELGMSARAQRLSLGLARAALSDPDAPPSWLGAPAPGDGDGTASWTPDRAFELSYAGGRLLVDGAPPPPGGLRLAAGGAYLFRVAALPCTHPFVLARGPGSDAVAHSPALQDGVTSADAALACGSSRNDVWFFPQARHAGVGLHARDMAGPGAGFALDVQVVGGAGAADGRDEL